MSSELKPCPFCGATDGTPKLDGHQGDKWGAVMCSCGVFGPEVRTGYDDSPNAPWHAEAIAAWNTRATQPPAVGVDVSEDWRIRAADWLERKAQEQEANNAKWPEHAAAYESWRKRPTEYRILANCVRTAALSRTDGESA